MKLRNYEIEAIVNSVYGKLEEIELEKLRKPEIVKEVNEINEELGNDFKEINLLIEEFKRKRNERYEYFKEKFGNKYKYYFDMNGMGYSEIKEFISEPKHNLICWIIKEKIRNKVILNNIKGEEIDKLIDNLVKEFSK